MSNRQCTRKLAHAEHILRQARAVAQAAAEAAQAVPPSRRTPDEQLAVDLTLATVTVLESYEGGNDV